MYRIPSEFIPGYSGTGTDQIPSSVDLICPRCGRQVNFALSNWQAAKSVNSKHAQSRCPGCGDVSFFYWVGNPAWIGNDETPSHDLYVHPDPKLIRRPIDGLNKAAGFPADLGGAYASAIGTYNVRQWTAAAVLIGRVLEGITRSVLPEDKHRLPLAMQIQELPEHIDLQEPIVRLSDAIRKGRNIGAHFDAELEPNQETTEQMLDLLDYAIEYLFILPGRIEELHDQLADTGGD